MDSKREQDDMKKSFFKSVKFLLWGGISGLPFVLTGCVPVAIFGVGAATVDVATQERGVSGTFNDTDIRAQINNLWFKKSVDLYSHVLLSVQDGYVLLTGTVPTEDDRLEAVKLAWQAKGVKDVFNEIQIGLPQSVGNGLDDTWISTKVRSGLVFEETVHSTNYSVTTFEGVVYLMGIAQNQQEVDAAINVAKDTRGVKNVVSHVQIRTPGKEGDQETSQAPLQSSEERVPQQHTDSLDVSEQAYPESSLETKTASPSSGRIQEEKLDAPL